MSKNKVIEDELDLAPMKNEENPKEKAKKALAKAKEIEDKLKDNQVLDSEMDEYAEVAYEAFKDIRDFGFNSEPRNAAELFNAAARMLEITMNAKNSKFDKRVKLAEIEMKIERLKLEREKFEREEPDAVEDLTTLMSKIDKSDK